MPKITIPADPEEMNYDRAEWALQGLRGFVEETGQSFDEDGYEEIIGDFLADLAHLCDRKGICLQERLAAAEYHYSEETDNEGIQFNTGDPVERMYDEALGVKAPRNDRPDSDEDSGADDAEE